MSITPSLPYRIALAGFFGLFALLMMWNTILTPNPKLPVAFMLIVTVSPLLLPMRGFLARCRKSSVWLAYISLLYFVHGCLEAFANISVRPYALLETLFSLMIFFGVLFYIRLSRSHP
jgi:uncharacterized membrane protein